MKSVLKVALVALPLLGSLVSCSKHNSPVLVERGVEPYEREYHVKQEGYGLSSQVKKTFMEGYVVEGMTQEMVRLLWGPPDREFNEGKTWEYVTNEGEIITKVLFDGEKVILNIPHKIVTDIQGDRFGGNPPKK